MSSSDALLAAARSMLAIWSPLRPATLSTERLPGMNHAAECVKTPPDRHNPVTTASRAVGLQRCPWKEQRLERVGVLHQRGTRSIQPERAQMSRHPMGRVSHSQHEAFTVTGMPWRRHLDEGLDDLLLKQAEGVQIGRGDRNRNATRPLERRDQPTVWIMHDGRKLLAVTFDLDVGHELVVAPQLLTRAVSRLGCHRKIRHIDSWSRILRCH